MKKVTIYLVGGTEFAFLFNTYNLEDGIWRFFDADGNTVALFYSREIQGMTF